MAHLVKCLICGQTFDRDKIPFIQVKAKRYAHKECVENPENQEKVKQESENDQFWKIVKQIFGPEYNYMLINTQAESYIQQFNYTWSGMAGTLHWFYNINNGSKEEGYGGIGIIPFIYDEAKKYYINRNKIQQENKRKEMREQIINFNIQSPRAWHRPPRLLNLEEDDNE